MQKGPTILAAVFVLLFFGFVSMKMGDAQVNNVVTANAVKAVSGETQLVKLSFDRSGYALEPSTLKKDVPVRMEVDMDTVYGCMRSVRIPSFGVSQTVREGNNIIEFTPDKSGTFNIACSMGMGRGQFAVEESDGSTADFIEAAPAATVGSCEEGCGCGNAA